MCLNLYTLEYICIKDSSLFSSTSSFLFHSLILSHLIPHFVPANTSFHSRNTTIPETIVNTTPSQSRTAIIESITQMLLSGLPQTPELLSILDNIKELTNP